MSFFRRQWAKFSSVRIVRKMALGYILLVILPVIMFGFYFYGQLYQDMMGEYAQSKQRLVKQAAGSFEVSLEQVKSIHSLFQYNAQVTEYLNGEYVTEVDQVYHYLKDIRPIFTFANLGNKTIKSIRLYKSADVVLPVQNEVESLKDFPYPEVQSQLNELKLNQGLWHKQDQVGIAGVPYIGYYQRLYNNSYTKQLAILEIVVDDRMLGNFIDAAKANPSIQAMIVQDGKIVYRSEGGYDDERARAFVASAASRANDEYWTDGDMLVNALARDDLRLTFYFFSPLDEMFSDFRKKTWVTGGLLFALLFMLSALYYLIASLLTKRILKLAKHMRRVDENNLSLYEGEVASDEIGFLTHSYNSMISRIDELLNKVQKAELMKKEADYLVMQAQIKPHFLYNTLESIRMLAEINDDQEVVSATHTLGKLLRYTLSSGDNETPLADEINNLRNYLEMYKLRMLDRLHYEIDVEAEIKDVFCPRFILQPLVENCIHHGVSKSRGQSEIRIRAADEGPFLVITISDNGAGMTAQRLELVQGVIDNRLDRSELQTEDSGLGLYNVSERIKVFFGEGSGLDIQSKIGEGTVYTVRLLRERRYPYAESDARR